MPKKSDLQITDAYLHALNEAKRLITQSQEQFLRSANRISMEIRVNLGKIVKENSIKYDWGKSYLALQNISKKWTMLIRDWKPALARFMIEFEGRV